MTRYVCGFRFSPDLRQVMLIAKKRPRWQAGKLNGIGGHIVEGESPFGAMAREFLEETDIETAPGDWMETITLKGDDFEVHFFKSVGRVNFVSMTDEVVGLYPARNLNALPLIYNLDWIIPMHLDDTVVWPVTVRGLTPC